MQLNHFTKRKWFSNSRILFYSVLFLFLNNTYSQGTNCGNATSLTVNGACGGSANINDNTQNNPLATGCGIGTFRREGWYTFNVTGGPLNVTITAVASNRDLYLQLISTTGGCGGTLTDIGCANSNTTAGGQTETITTILSNGTYYIKVLNVGTNNNMNLTSICVTGVIAPPSPINDNCTGAIALTVNTTCSYSTYTNLNATNSTIPSTPPAPGCANYMGGDVWFSVVVPTGGNVRISTQSGVLTDGGMAAYSGTCGVLSLITCNDDTNGLMPALNLIGQPVGSTIYIRFWEYGNDNNGTFDICAYAPTPCTPGPGTGTSTLGCPSVVSGGLGLSGADPAPISCSTSGCVDLEASYLKLGQTTGYTVESIAYNPPYQFGCLANPVSVNTDDVWSPIINLPFNFCFYGNNYNQCAIGSNGVLTFDTTKAGTSSGYSFSNNLPSTTGALFANTIYGVYHDIDPSVGGEVGWELVTLGSGCRALVASWNNVPMFSDNTLLYTGMMVLYENTNIIEVYIKDKKIDGTWNGGNAIVGIQDSTGTQAVVAPGRNGLDTDWTVTNEAWRLTPSGASITTIKWYQGAGTTGPVVGTTDTVNVCPSTTTIYTAEVTYTLCGGSTVKVTDQTTVTVSANKVWNGSVSTDWNVANNWTPNGLPTATESVNIPNVANKPVIGSGTNALACSLTIANGSSLTVNANNNLTITNALSVGSGATFNVDNNGSLVQINNVPNTVNGTFNFKRTAPSIKGSDYVYWSSPVLNQNISTIYSTTTPGPKYQWNTTIANANSGLGNWESPTGNMTPARGYIMRGSSNYSLAATNLIATFTGVPNNGNITIKATRGNMVPANVGPSLTYTNTALNAWDDNWSLLGNPYPSAINALQFLSTNSTDLMGTVRLWRHLSSPAAISSPFYQNFVYNYNSSDYLTINYTGPTTPGASDIIKSGQGFLVQRKEGTQDLTGVDVVFNNSMRLTPTSTVMNNGGFFKNVNNASNIEKHRIWLDIIEDSTNNSETALIGYVEGATANFDDNYDATIGITTTIGIYSFAENQKCIIQGKPIPFSIEDKVSIGINVQNNGSYHIAIKAIDGLFDYNAQNIYLEDKLLNTIHNLTSSPYQFNTNQGNINDRFILRYTQNSLSNTEFDYNNQVNIYINEGVIIKSSEENITEVMIYDVLGRNILSQNNINEKEIVLTNLKPTKTPIIVKTTLQNNKVVTRKLIY